MIVSASALSYASPTEPIDGVSPARNRASPNRTDVRSQHHGPPERRSRSSNPGVTTPLGLRALADVVRRTIKVATSSGTREDGTDWWFDAVEKVVVYINPVPNKHGDYGSVFVVMRDNYPLPDGTIVNPTP